MDLQSLLTKFGSKPLMLREIKQITEASLRIPRPADCAAGETYTIYKSA